MKSIFAFILAVLTTYIVGIVFISQGNIAALIEMGIKITLLDRLQAILHDLQHMLGLYLPLAFIALLIAFVFTRWAIFSWAGRRPWLYLLAGFVAMISLHWLAQLALGVTPIAPTRTTIGLLLQGIAGAVGGFVFTLYNSQKSR